MNIKTLIGSIFNKTKRDINNEKRQRIENDNSLQTQVNNIKDGNNIDSFGDVESVLNTKQNKLTAGNNITIANNVISASDGHLYEHCIYMVSHRVEYLGDIKLRILTNTSVPLTLAELKEIMTVSYNSYNRVIDCVGRWRENYESSFQLVYQIYINNNEFYFIDVLTNTSTKFNFLGTTFIDGVRQIL